MSEQKQWWEASGAAVYELRGDRQFEALTGNEANTLADYLNDLEALASGLYRALEELRAAGMGMAGHVAHWAAPCTKEPDCAVCVHIAEWIEARKQADAQLTAYKAQSRG